MSLRSLHCGSLRYGVFPIPKRSKRTPQVQGCHALGRIPMPMAGHARQASARICTVLTHRPDKARQGLSMLELLSIGQLAITPLQGDLPGGWDK